MTRRQSMVLVGALASGFIAAGTWRAVHRHRARSADNAAAARPLVVAGAAPGPTEETPFVLPDEPAPPPLGSAAREVYFAALVEGDERALEIAHSAVADAETTAAIPSYVRRMRAMERAYTERLARHRQELRSSNP